MRSAGHVQQSMIMLGANKELKNFLVSFFIDQIFNRDFLTELKNLPPEKVNKILFNHFKAEIPPISREHINSASVMGFMQVYSKDLQLSCQQLERGMQQLSEKSKASPSDIQNAMVFEFNKQQYLMFLLKFAIGMQSDAAQKSKVYSEVIESIKKMFENIYAVYPVSYIDKVMRLYLFCNSQLTEENKKLLLSAAEIEKNKSKFQGRVDFVNAILNKTRPRKFDEAKLVKYIKMGLGNMSLLGQICLKADLEAEAGEIVIKVLNKLNDKQLQPTHWIKVQSYALDAIKLVLAIINQYSVSKDIKFLTTLVNKAGNLSKDNALNHEEFKKISGTKAELENAKAKCALHVLWLDQLMSYIKTLLAATPVTPLHDVMLTLSGQWKTYLAEVTTEQTQLICAQEKLTKLFDKLDGKEKILSVHIEKKSAQINAVLVADEKAKKDKHKTKSKPAAAQVAKLSDKRKEAADNHGTAIPTTTAEQSSSSNKETSAQQNEKNIEPASADVIPDHKNGNSKHGAKQKEDQTLPEHSSGSVNSDKRMFATPGQISSATFPATPKSVAVPKLTTAKMPVMVKNYASVVKGNNAPNVLPAKPAAVVTQNVATAAAAENTIRDILGAALPQNIATFIAEKNAAVQTSPALPSNAAVVVVEKAKAALPVVLNFTPAAKTLNNLRQRLSKLIHVDMSDCRDINEFLQTIDSCYSDISEFSRQIRKEFLQDEQVLQSEFNEVRGYSALMYVKKWHDVVVDIREDFVFTHEFYEIVDRLEYAFICYSRVNISSNDKLRELLQNDKTQTYQFVTKLVDEIEAAVNGLLNKHIKLSVMQDTTKNVSVVSSEKNQQLQSCKTKLQTIIDKLNAMKSHENDAASGQQFAALIGRATDVFNKLNYCDASVNSENRTSASLSTDTAAIVTDCNASVFYDSANKGNTPQAINGAQKPVELKVPRKNSP